MNNACIIGYGVVGKATALAFGITKHFDINGDATITLNDAANCRYVFICLPTPTVNGDCDTRSIRETIRQIEGIRANPLYIIRSTVIPGTANAIMEELNMDRVISNPEFLKQVSDFIAELDNSQKTTENSTRFNSILQYIKDNKFIV